jgi:hypothetical protein
LTISKKKGNKIWKRIKKFFKPVYKYRIKVKVEGVLFYELEATNEKSFKESTKILLKKIGCPVSLRFAIVTKNGRVSSNKSLAMVKWATRTIVHHDTYCKSKQEVAGKAKINYLKNKVGGIKE